MTIQNTTSKIREDGNGVKSVFSFSFKIFTETDIEVSTIVKSTGIVTLKVLNTDYTVQINAITEGGTVTYITTVPSALEEFFAIRVVPNTQPTNIPNVGSIREEQIETPLDRRTMVSQQQQEALDRTLKFSEISEQSSIDVPEPEANKALFWDALGTGLENRDLDVTSGTFPGDFDAGLDANKAVSPSTNDVYIATDTFRIYRCFSSGVWSTKQVFSEEINLAKGADIASGATTDIGAATGNFIDVTGTITITGLGTIQAGTSRLVRFTGILTLTHNATSLILPGTANITTAVNDRAVFVSLGSGNWICTNYSKASGESIVVPDGTVIQTVKSQDQTERSISVTTGIPGDDSKPEKTQGGAYSEMDRTITAKSIGNTLEIDAQINGSVSDGNGASLRICLFRDDEQFAIAFAISGINTAGFSTPNMNPRIFFKLTPADTDEHTYKIRVGVSTGTFNPIMNSDLGNNYGNLFVSSMTIKELKGSV